jgi:hypothetical protein
LREQPKQGRSTSSSSSTSPSSPTATTEDAADMHMVRMVGRGKGGKLIRNVAFPKSVVQVDDDEGREFERCG